MNGKVNTPRTVCRAIVAVAIAAIALAAIIGCSSLGGGSRRQNIATVIQTAYDLGGREAVSNKIESLVAEGKLTPSQAVRLHALAQLAYEGIMDDIAAGGGAATNAAPPPCTPMTTMILMLFLRQVFCLQQLHFAPFPEDLYSDQPFSGNCLQYLYTSPPSCRTSRQFQCTFP